MPVVPKYSSSQVQSQDLPSVRLNTSVPVEAFGGGEARASVTKATQTLMDTTGRIVQQQAHNADQLRVLDSDKDLSEYETNILYNPQTGALNKRGKDAFGIHEQVHADFSKHIEDLEKGFSNDNQRVAFRRIAFSRLADIDRQIERHVSNETRQYDTAVTDSFIANERNAATANYHDLERINKAVDNVQKAINEHGDRNGQPEEWKQNKITEAVSKTHMDVISRMLANNEDLTAKAYYEKLKSQSPGSLENAPGLLESGNINLKNRPRVQNPDGTVSTVRSISVGIDGKEVLIPTVSDDGRNLTKAEAVEQYKQTGKHLGIFKDVASANSFGILLHKQQEAQLYGPRGEITGGDAIHIEKALEEGTLRGESQRQADLIFSKKLTLSESLDIAKQIKDPKVRDETERRLEHNFNQVEASKSLMQKNLFLESSNLIDKNPNVPARDLIPPATWSQLTPEQKNALENRAEAPIANDSKGWLNFMTLSPDALAKMDKAEFEVRWSKFDKEHRTRAESMWNSAREAGAKAALDPKLTSVINAHEQLVNSLKASKLIDPNKSIGTYTEKEAVFLAKIANAAAKNVEEFELTQLGGKRKSTYEERQKIYDDLVIKKVFIEKAWAKDEEIPVALVTDDQKKDAYYPINKIPEADKNDIIKILDSKHKKITQRKIERAYGAYLNKDKKRFYQIIEE